MLGMSQEQDARPSTGPTPPHVNKTNEENQNKNKINKQTKQ
jgi:hypothetical protein